MPSSPKSGVVYLIDAHSLIFQVFHADSGMTRPTGLPTNAVFGFVRDLMFLRRKKPDYLVCAFDRAEPTFRSDLYPDYKAHRDPVPDNLVSQLPLIERAVAALNIPVVSHPKYEADDVLATLARAASNAASTFTSAPATRTAASLSTNISASTTCASTRSWAGPNCWPTGA